MMHRFGTLLFLFLFFHIPGVGALSVADTLDVDQLDHKEDWDRSTVEHRTLPKEKLAEWKHDPRYQYDRGQDRPGFWNFLYSRVLHWLFSASGDWSWTYYVILIVAGLLALLALLRVLDIPVSGLFVMSRKNEDSTLRFNEEDEDYTPSKLKEMLRLFRNNGAYREAVRVMFLLYLRELHEQGLIAIRRFKTNYDYFREINSPKEKEKFRKRMRLFDIIWYGHAELSSVQFREIEKIFKNKSEGRGAS
ncbi:MAG: hypothetical protein ACOCPW_01290 [Marinilabiliaceae bacterium]